ncbi:flagellar filament capping protein FliD [Aneurinibacillus sp. BA2021]|nr:flagellar filament capping protein FliD [Aneurinibacillus sp. BA2021]
MYGTNLTRISGMASGMDTESLVKKLMDAERIPVNKLRQNREKLGWQSDAYRKWNMDIFSFRTKTLFDMKLSKTYGTFSVGSSQADKITGTATADAIPGTYTVKVNQLAEGATLQGKLAGAASDKLVDKETTFSIAVNGKQTEITLGPDDTVNELVNKLNKASATVDGKQVSLGVQAMYDPTLNQLIIRTRDTGSIQSLSIKNGESTSESDFSSLVGKLGLQQKPSIALSTGSTTLATEISGDLEVTMGNTVKTVSLAPGSTVKTLLDKLAAEGINAKLDEAGQSLIMSSDSASSFSIKASSGDFSALGLSNGSTTLSTDKYMALGKDARVNFNGTDVRVSSNTASFFGVNYTFKTLNPEGSTITVARDLDAEIKNIKEFIDKYNELLEKLTKTVEEPVYKKYQPLTDEERKALSEKQIEQWEEKAKSGLLRRDSTLSGLANAIRQNMMSKVDNGSQYSSLSAIGIKSASYTDKGKLTVDEEKLKKALQEDPEAVKNLFIQGGDITADDIKKDPTKQGQRGLIHRLYDDFGAAFDQLKEKVGLAGSAQNDESSIGKMLQNLDKRISSMDARLIDRENRYYRQFTAMEKAMSKFNSQGSWLAQQFGGGA